MTTIIFLAILGNSEAYTLKAVENAYFNANREVNDHITTSKTIHPQAEFSEERAWSSWKIIEPNRIKIYRSGWQEEESMPYTLQQNYINLQARARIELNNCRKISCIPDFVDQNV